MSKENGGPAFPREDYQTKDAPGKSGMSMRDYFAAKAMQGLLASWGEHDVTDYNEIAHDSYLAADAMLKERKQ